MRAVWVHDNRQPMSNPLLLITPAHGKYWIFTFAYSILASHLAIWISMNWRALPTGCPQLPTNPSVDPAVINILTSLFQKVSMQSIIGASPSDTQQHKQGLVHPGSRSFFTAGMYHCAPLNPLISNDILAVIFHCANISIKQQKLLLD